MLSALAGAAQELQDALIINPWRCGLRRRADPRHRDAAVRAHRAHARHARAVAGRNVFSWASDVLEGLESLWSKPLHYITRGAEDAPV